MNSAVARNGGRVIALPAVDLSRVEDTRVLAAALRTQLEKLRGFAALDVLVHNSGTSWGEPFDGFPEKGWDRVMDLCVSPLLVCACFLFLFFC